MFTDHHIAILCVWLAKSPSPVRNARHRYLGNTIHGRHRPAAVTVSSWTAHAGTLGRLTSGRLVTLADDVSTVQIDDEVIACRVVISLSKFRFPNRLDRLSLSLFVTFRIFRSTILIIFGHIDVIRTAILVPIPYSHSEEVSAHGCVVNISYALRQYARRWLRDKTDRSPKSPSPGTMNESLSRPSSTQAVICNTVQI
jgi:hypothetical protein